MDTQLISADEYEYPLNASDRGLLCNCEGKIISDGSLKGKPLIYPKEENQNKKLGITFL